MQYSSIKSELACRAFSRGYDIFQKEDDKFVLCRPTYFPSDKSYYMLLTDIEISEYFNFNYP